MHPLCSRANNQTDISEDPGNRMSLLYKFNHDAHAGIRAISIGKNEKDIPCYEDILSEDQRDTLGNHGISELLEGIYELPDSKTDEDTRKILSDMGLNEVKEQS